MNTKIGTEILLVAATSVPSSIAGALAGMIKEEGFAELQAVGAGAVNQAVKAVAIARGFLAPLGYDLVCIPAFTDIMLDDQQKTGMKLIVVQR